MKPQISLGQLLSVLTFSLFAALNVSAQTRLDQLLNGGGSNAPVTVVDYRYCQTPIKSQEDRGTCTAFAVMAAMEVFPGTPLDLSEQFAYADVKLNMYLKTDVYEGEELGNYVKSLSGNGVVREDQEPYNPRATIWTVTDDKMDQFSAEVGGSRIYDLFTFSVDKFKLRKGFYTLISGDQARHSKQKIQELLRGGLTCIPVGYGIYSPAWAEHTGKMGDAIHPDAVYMVEVDGKLVSYTEAKKRYPNVADLINTGELLVAQDTTSKHWGGHAVCIVGYNSEGFIIKNSWSEKWGDKGYGLISYDYHEVFANEVLALQSVYAEHATKNNIPVTPDFRLKVIPKYRNNLPCLQLSLCSFTDGPMPAIDYMSYRFYTVDASGNKQLITDHPVLLGVFSTDWGYHTDALSGHNFTIDDLTGKTITAELTYRVKGSLLTYTKTYSGIKFKVGEYRGVDS